MKRSQLAEIYLRLLLGMCPNIEREGRMCGLCQEACGALGYEVNVMSQTASVWPEGLREDPLPRFADAGPLVAELMEKVGHHLTEANAQPEPK